MSKPYRQPIWWESGGDFTDDPEEAEMWKAMHADGERSPVVALYAAQETLDLFQMLDIPMPRGGELGAAIFGVAHADDGHEVFFAIKREAPDGTNMPGDARWKRKRDGAEMTLDSTHAPYPASDWVCVSPGAATSGVSSISAECSEQPNLETHPSDKAE